MPEVFKPRVGVSKPPLPTFSIGLVSLKCCKPYTFKVIFCPENCFFVFSHFLVNSSKLCRIFVGRLCGTASCPFSQSLHIDLLAEFGIHKIKHIKIPYIILVPSSNSSMRLQQVIAIFFDNEWEYQRDINVSNTSLYALSMTHIPAPCSDYFFDTLWHILNQAV